MILFIYIFNIYYIFCITYLLIILNTNDILFIVGIPLVMEISMKALKILVYLKNSLRRYIRLKFIIYILFLICIILITLLLVQGREYCFISNIDNLGATVDLRILKLLLDKGHSSSPEFVMEITDKTRADVKVSFFLEYSN